MEVILNKDVQNVGEAGDMVNVKDGYARNFLFPQNLAVKATKGAVKNREQNLARIKAKQEKLHAEALVIAEKLGACEALEISARAGESGKLFGTVTTKRLSEEIKNATGIEVERKNITLDAPMNKVGSFTMTIKLTSKVKVQMNVNVSASEVLKEEIEETVVSEEE